MTLITLTLTKSAGLVLAVSTGWFSEPLPVTDGDRYLEEDGCMVRECELQLSGLHLVYILCRVTTLATAPRSQMLNNHVTAFVLVCHERDGRRQRMKSTLFIGGANIVKLTEAHVSLIAMRLLAKHDGSFEMKRIKVKQLPV